MDYKQLAQSILENIGGKNNIKKVNKDYTNLRFVLKNKKLANKEAVEKIEGVKSVQVTDTHFNVMIGAKVPEVYKELIAITGEIKEEMEVISPNAVLNAKLKMIFKSIIVPFIILLVLYVAMYFASVYIPEASYKYLNIICMGLWVVYVAYVAQRCGQIFKADTTLTSLITGVAVGINAYYLNIVVIFISIILVILTNILAFKVTKNKRKK